MLKEIAPSNIPEPYGRNKPKGYWIDTITSFLDSDMSAAKVSEDGMKFSSVYSALKIANTRMGNPVMIKTRKKEVYLLKREE